MAGREKKRERRKFEYLKNEKSFLDEIKSIFHNYLRAKKWFGEKIEKLRRQALNSLLIKVLCNRIICNATMCS